MTPMVCTCVGTCNGDPNAADCKGLPTHTTGSPMVSRYWEIGNPDSFVCIGYRCTRDYSPRTKTHRHYWFNIGRFGFIWERPRYNR
jgi:hypothetical protein